MSQNAVAEP